MRSRNLLRLCCAAGMLLMCGLAGAGESRHFGHGHDARHGHSVHRHGPHCPQAHFRGAGINNPYHSRRLLGHAQGHHRYGHDYGHAARHGYHHRRSVRPSYYGRSRYGHLPRHRSGRSYGHYGGRTVVVPRRSYGLSLYSRH